MRIGYILTTFPSRTETFAAAEIEDLRKLGFIVFIFAAINNKQLIEYYEDTSVCYRPSLFSMEAFLSICYLFFKYPLALGRLFYLIIIVFKECPREAISLIGNIHTIGFFARQIDRESISHIHSYFLNWQAIIGLGLSVATNRSFSISSHARDIFVEQGAIKSKVSRAKFVTTCTQQGLKKLKAGLPEEYHHKLCLCYHGIKTVSGYIGRNDKDICETDINNTVVAVGRMVPKKGFGGLLKAFALVVRKNPNCRLIIVGNGPEHKQLIELVEQLAIKSHVKLLGWKLSNETIKIIRQAAILVVPSVVADDGDRDGIPNVILEAFANGTPVIASKLEGICEVVEHHKNGLLVKPGNVTELASAINKLLSNMNMQKQFSQMAYQTVQQRFNSARNAIQLAKIFISTI